MRGVKQLWDLQLYSLAVAEVVVQDPITEDSQESIQLTQEVLQTHLRLMELWMQLFLLIVTLQLLADQEQETTT